MGCKTSKATIYSVKDRRQYLIINNQQRIFEFKNEKLLMMIPIQIGIYLIRQKQPLVSEYDCEVSSLQQNQIKPGGIIVFTKEPYLKQTHSKKENNNKQDQSSSYLEEPKNVLKKIFDKTKEQEFIQNTFFQYTNLEQTTVTNNNLNTQTRKQDSYLEKSIYESDDNIQSSYRPANLKNLQRNYSPLSQRVSHENLQMNVQPERQFTVKDSKKQSVIKSESEQSLDKDSSKSIQSEDNQSQTLPKIQINPNPPQFQEFQEDPKPRISRIQRLSKKLEHHNIACLPAINRSSYQGQQEAQVQPLIRITQIIELSQSQQNPQILLHSQNSVNLVQNSVLNSQNILHPLRGSQLSDNQSPNKARTMRP
ncbi:UNKNOWN [Stylonychia lemnae]|uniref:Uncharacterized protein n=1 Tax=Stylonychia lemnae TaxID=5949 RepID=A0A078A805_STYLE|nr:UNKNOWN [Stylonychia lemnae]|eukprot:CDW77717.1 UNKNOWN [Stylonychia lemnae]